MAIVKDFNNADGPYSGNAEIVVGNFRYESGILRITGEAPAGDARILWVSSANGTVSLDVRRTLQSGAYVGIMFRASDENNCFSFINRGQDNRCRLIKTVNGSTAENLFDLNPSISSNNNPRLLSVSFNGGVIRCFQDGEQVGPDIEDSYNQNEVLVGIRVGSTDFHMDDFTFPDPQAAGDPVPDLPALEVPFALDGFARQVTKIGKIFDRPSTMPDNEEFWFRAYETETVASWPSDKYPVILYSSSDHSTGEGGIYVRVWEKSLGPIYDGSAWLEWDQVSGRAEFSHISKKTNPIYSLGVQTETPQIVIENGVVHLFTHDGSVNVDPEYGGNVQATTRSTGDNLIDFTHRNVVNAYNPKLFSGDGHSGYFDIGENNNPALPYKYLAKQTKGGGANNRGPSVRIVGVNDLSARYFDELADVGRMQGSLSDYSPAGKESWIYIPENPHNQIKEGAYWRIKGTFRPDVVVGGQDEGATPCEFLVDDNFNFVAAPKLMLELGQNGEFDDLEIQNFSEISYDGETFAFYKAMSSASPYSTVGVARVEESRAQWEVIQPFSERSVISSSADFTHSAPTSQKTIENVPSTLLTLPLSGDEVTAEGSPFTPEDHDVIDIIFKNIGKDTSDAISLEFGIIDDLAQPTLKMNYRFNPRSTATTSSARAEQMKVDVLAGVASDGSYGLRNYFGQSGGRNADRDGDESAQARHNVGLRLIPAQGKLIVIEGVGEQEVFDISGFDYRKALKPFIKAKLDSSAGANPATSDGGVTFEEVRVITYSSGAVAVPSSPAVTVSKSARSVTATASTVPGAAGYKYVLDGVENETGAFTGLEPETSYTLYARAFNALGDSEPSAPQIVTTDAESVVPDPTAIAGQNITATVGQAIQLTGATVTDADAVAWTCTSGQTPTIVNGDTLTPTITFNEPGAHTLRLTATNAVGEAFAELQATVEDVATVIQSTILLSLPGIPDGAHDVVIVDRVGGINLTVEGVTFANGTGSALIPLAIGSAVDYYTYNETTREAGLQVEGITA